ncbi:hypothetical protein OG780_44035 [Streptomyces sp. NBC_00386]|uniref:DUF7489 domain-containing protein n=1 Tax=Streptomyces sp. NBC_00386 TaxID=2975734 RepID=UPI002E233A84
MRHVHISQTRTGRRLEGIVEDKSRGMLDGANMYHFIEVRRTDGQSMKVRIDRRLWKSIEVGDRIVKESSDEL